MFTSLSMWFLIIGAFIIGTLSFEREIRENYDPMSDEFITFINSEAKTWKAGRNFDKGITIEQLRHLALAKSGRDPTVETISHDKIGVEIPKEFDSRTNWHNCPSIREIRNQGYCGSCWAFASTEVMTDRTCIHSNGTQNFHYSAEDLTTCSFVDHYSEGCNGGWPILAFKYWKKNGIVSGGPYNSKQGCQPYFIIPTDGPKPPPANGSYWTPPCVQKCEAGYKKTYEQDLHYGEKAYYIYQEDMEKQTQIEIMKNGPVATSMSVYEDFIHYQTGVYQRISGELLGLHAVKIIGWGTENGTPYWLVSNSWGTKWGELGGFFKILRRKDFSGFDKDIVGGIPKL